MKAARFYRVFARIAPGLLLLASGGKVWAAAGKEAAGFLDIPVGAGPAAMGGAYSALSDDAFAPVYNPGGLGFLDSTQVSGQHLAYLESIHYEELSIVHPLGGPRTAEGERLTAERAFGFSAQYLGSGDIPGTDGHGASTGEFSTHYGAYAAAFGQKLGDHAAVGATAKFIESRIDDVSAHAYAGDLGALWKPNGHLALAAVVMNMGSKLTFIRDGGELPLTGKLGLGWAPNAQWKMSLEGQYDRSAFGSAHMGLQWRPLATLALRAGYRTDTTKELGALAGFSTGIGLDLWGQELAYAWVPYGDLGNTQYFSLLMRFGAVADRKRNLIQYQTIKAHRTVRANDPDFQQLLQLLTDHDRSQAAKEVSLPGAKP